MKRLLVIPVVLAALVIAGIHLSGADAPVDRADFAFVNRGDNKCLDPNGMSWMQDIRIAYALWEGLYALDPVTLKPIPGTADRIDIDPTQTIYTFHIRDNAKWSNGNAVTAGDFVFAWRRMLESPGEYSYLFNYIKGAEQFVKTDQAYYDAKGKGPTTLPSADFDSVGIKARDAHTLVITLENPVTFFPSLCAFPPFFPLHEPSMRQFAIKGEDGRITYDRKFTRPPYLVTNGPYRMDEWTFRKRVRMVASDYYWDREHVLSRTIDQVYADNSLAAFRLYERGEVDWLADIDADLAGPMVAAGGRTDLHVFPAFGTYFYSLNCSPKFADGRDNPLVDVRVRQALAMAIDKTPIVRDVGQLGQPIATTYIPRGVFDGYQSPPGLALDIKAAQKLLADAGYPDGRGFPQLKILYNSEGNHGDIAQIVRRQWIDNLNVKVELESVEIKTFGDRLQHQKYDIARASWYGDYRDPSTFTDKYKSDSDGNNSAWKNHEYDKLCAAAALETDPAKRLLIFSKAENILLNEAPIIPMYQYVNAYMFRDTVSGIPLDSQAMLMFKTVKVKR